MELSHFAINGYALIPQVLTIEQCVAVATKLACASVGSAGTRCLLHQAWCRVLSTQVREHLSMTFLIPPSFIASQCTYFEKSSSRNWLVPVHQDLSIAVAERVEHDSLSGWSEKEGALYVHAPVELLQKLVAVRVHIDACTAIDGPLRVLPGSHLRGRVDAGSAAAARQAQTEVICIAERGSALAMRPLLLHSSSKSQGCGKRRVLHFLFGPRVLPLGLQWQNAV